MIKFNQHDLTSGSSERNLSLKRLWLNFTLGGNLFFAVRLIRETCATTTQAGTKYTCQTYNPDKYQTNTLHKYQTYNADRYQTNTLYQYQINRPDKYQTNNLIFASEHLFNICLEYLSDICLEYFVPAWCNATASLVGGK